MGLDGVDVVRREARRREGLLHHTLLGGPVGNGQALTAAVLVDRAAADHRQHAVAVALGVGEPLQNQHARALRPAGAVGVDGEALAAAVRGHALELAGLHEQHRRAHHGDAAGEGGVALAVAQRAHRGVQGDERRRAGRVYGHGGTLESQDVGDTAGDDTAGDAGALVAVQVLEAGLVVRVVRAHGAEVDARPAAAQRLRRYTGAFQGLPDGLQDDPLLRVHRLRLARGDPEELRVEALDVLEEPALTGVGLAGGLRRRVVQVQGVPPGGETADGVPPFVQQLPVLLGVGDPAGETTGHRHDRDRFGALFLQLGVALLKLQHRGHRATQAVIVPGPVHIRHSTRLRHFSLRRALEGGMSIPGQVSEHSHNARKPYRPGAIRLLKQFYENVRGVSESWHTTPVRTV